MEFDHDAVVGVNSEALLQAAATAGFRVSARMLETFRAQGLIPRPVRIGHQGRSPLWTYPPGADRQLLSLLGWREHTKDVGTLRVLVWLDGFPIPAAEIRSALIHSLQTVLDLLDREITLYAQRNGLDPRADGDRVHVVDTIAHVLAAKRGPNALPRHTRVGAAERARSAGLILRIFALGELIDGTAEEAGMVERVLGIAPNGRRQRVFGAEPWLTGPAEALFDAAKVVSLPKLLQAVTDATDADLQSARQALVALFRYMPLMARMLAAVTGDDNFAGMAQLGHFDRHPEVVMFLFPAVVGMLRAGWEDNIRQVTTALAVFPDLAAQAQRILEMPSNTIETNLKDQPTEIQEGARRIIQAAIEGQFDLAPAPPNRSQ